MASSAVRNLSLLGCYLSQPSISERVLLGNADTKVVGARSCRALESGRSKPAPLRL